jgi:hypothetical protein
MGPEMANLERGDIDVVFQQLRIRHPRIAEVTKKFNSARKTKRLAPYTPKRYVEFFAESHTGKSTAVQTYLEDVVVPEVIAEGLFPADMPKELIAMQQTRVIHVTLTEKATRKSLYSDILRRLGDDRAEHGDHTILRKRVTSFLGDKSVELLILDEIQHLSVGMVRQVEGRRTRGLQTQGTDVSDALKKIMIDGLVPIVFVGVPEAKVHFSVDEQLGNRELDKIDFSPIRWTVKEERDLFVDYCAETGVLIEHHGLLPEISDFVSDGIPACLWAASRGRIGLASRICEEAVFHASDRGAQRVEFEDFERAVDTRAIPNGFCLYNPFTLGVRDLSSNGP